MIGCAAVPVKREIETKRTINQKYDIVWAKTIKALAEENMAIRTTDKASGLVTFDALPDADFYLQYFDCGKSGIFQPTYRPIQLNIYIADNKTTSDVKINLNGSYVLVDAYGHTVKQIQCFSNGKFEQSIFAELVK